MTLVRQHERQKPRKPNAYVETHLALFSRRADKIAFLQLHGIPLVGSDDPRLADPVPAPSKAASAMSLDEISEQLHGLADQMSRIGREAE